MRTVQGQRSWREDPCIKKLPSVPCEYCDLLTPEQVIQFSTPTYKIRKEKQKIRDTLVDPNSVTVLSHVEQEDPDSACFSHNTSADLSLPQPSLCKELQELDEKWSARMARLEALLTLGQHSTPQPSFPPVKALVAHKPPAGALSQAPFLISAVSSCFKLARIELISTSMDMSSLLKNLYPETEPDPEPVFTQPSPVPAIETSTGPLSASARDYIPPELVEEWELSDSDDHSNGKPHPYVQGLVLEHLKQGL